jgi:hypothetical protein
MVRQIILTVMLAAARVAQDDVARMDQVVRSYVLAKRSAGS